jgi:hypothetical protein
MVPFPIESLHHALNSLASCEHASCHRRDLVSFVSPLPGDERPPFKTQAVQFLGTGESHMQFLSFYLNCSFGFRPLRNITVPVDFAVVGKLAQTFSS